MNPTQTQIEAAAKVLNVSYENKAYAIKMAKAALTAAAEVGEQRAERLRLELEKIAWMDEFLDADGAKAMMNIAREAINNDN